MNGFSPNTIDNSKSLRSANNMVEWKRRVPSRSVSSAPSRSARPHFGLHPFSEQRLFVGNVRSLQKCGPLHISFIAIAPPVFQPVITPCAFAGGKGVRIIRPFVIDKRRQSIKNQAQRMRFDMYRRRRMADRSGRRLCCGMPLGLRCSMVRGMDGQAANWKHPA